jgi:hypothetical protein
VWSKDTAQTYYTNGNAYFGTSKTYAPDLASPAGFFSGMGNMYTYYRSNATESVFTGPSSNANSYDMRMNLGSRTPGNYGGINMDSGIGSLDDNSEANLRGFDAAGSDQFVDLFIWHIYRASSTAPAVYVDADLSTPDVIDYAAVLRIYEDGSVVLNPTVVPIPASLLLFGSGLLGLIGLRRKTA